MIIKFFKDFKYKVNHPQDIIEILSIYATINNLTPFNGVYINYNSISIFTRDIDNFDFNKRYSRERYKKITDYLIKENILEPFDKNSKKYKLNLDRTDNKGDINLKDYLTLKSNLDKKLFKFLSSVCFFKTFSYLLFWNRLTKEYKNLKKVKRAIKRINKYTSLRVGLEYTKQGVIFHITKTIKHKKSNKTKLTGSELYKTTQQYKKKRDKKIFENIVKKRENQQKEIANLNIQENQKHSTQAKIHPLNIEYEKFKQWFSDIDIFFLEYLEFIKDSDVGLFQTYQIFTDKYYCFEYRQLDNERNLRKFYRHLLAS